MSASSKKKLRNEQQAEKLTERQLAEQKEAKKLKFYTVTFVAVLAVLLVIAIVFGVTTHINNSGNRERKTVALTVGEHQISNAEMNYYFIDSINSFFSGDNAYMVQLGLLDTSLPLDEQVNPLTGQNWAEYLMEYATQNIRSNYALVDAAKAEGFTMPEEYVANRDSVINNMELYATIYGYSDADSYLRGMYGPGANMENYTNYVDTSIMAQAYYNTYGQTLAYEDADLRAAESVNPEKYNSYNYNYYYVNASKFLEGGTTDSEGNVTYSDAETEASIKAAEEVAKALCGEEITSVEAFDAAIAELSINAESETPVSSNAYENALHTSVIDAEVADWLAEASRKEGDMTYIVNEVSSTDSETGETTTTINGYYVVYFQSAQDNTFALKNVRHILAAFEGGTTDSTTGTTTFSDEEKAAAKAIAEEWLAQWKAGEATEDSFAALANEKSADGDGTTGGLYENIYPGQMVAGFEDWSFAEGRKAGDTGIVETEYGYHVMYFSGESDVTYRDYMIESELRTADLNAWYTGLIENVTITEGDTSYVSTDIVLNSGN